MTPARLLRRFLPALLASMAAGTAIVSLAGPASAHDVLIGTSPKAGATVTALPSAVVLTFDRPALALGSAMRILGPAGNAAQGSPELVDATVSQALRPGSPAGTYTVQWRVTSADGHPISGQFRFTLAAQPGTAPTATSSASAAPTAPATSVAAGPSTAAAAAPLSAGTGGGRSLPWIAVGAAAILAAGAALAWRAKRSRRTDPAGR